MMRSKRYLIGAALVALAGASVAPPPTAASTTRTVSLTANQFAPSMLDRLTAGDTVRWNWLDGIHHISAYQNGTFDSGTQSAPNSFSTVYGGGVVKYRCLIHSSLGGVTCAGMCGVLTDREIDLTPPVVTIEQPRGGLEPVIATPTAGFAGVNFPVTISGSATDNVAVFGGLVRIYDIRSNGITPSSAGYAREFHIPESGCLGCGTPAAQWSVTISLLPGPYTAEVVIADTSGNVPKTAPRVSFVVV